MFYTAASLPGVFHAHPGGHLEHGDPWGWAAWNWEPGVLILMVASAAIYSRGVARLWRRLGRGHGARYREVWYFGAALATLLLALCSPIDRLSSALFSLHMVQHLLLILVAAPLLVLSRPGQVSLWALGNPLRRRVGRWWVGRTGLRLAWRVVTRPIVALTLHTLALWTWHFPGPYDAALHHEAVHAAEHASFFLTAVLFWWVLVRRGSRRMELGGFLLYLFAALMQSGLLGALLTFASQPWYSWHAHTTQAWGLSPLDDQRLAGLIMWIPASLFYLGAMIQGFLTRLSDMDRRFPPVMSRRSPQTVPSGSAGP